MVATWKMNFPPTQTVTSKVLTLECPSSCHPTAFIPASSLLDSPAVSLGRPASTGSAVLRNEAKLGSGCKRRADGATCAHTGDASLSCPPCHVLKPYL